MRKVLGPLSSMSMSFTTGDKVFAWWHGTNTWEPAVVLDCVSAGTDEVIVLWWMEFSTSSLLKDHLRLAGPLEHKLRVVARWYGHYHPAVVWAPDGCTGAAKIAVRWTEEWSQSELSVDDVFPWQKPDV